MEYLLFRNAGPDEAKDIEMELDKPLPGEARRAPSPRESAEIKQEWASFMKSVG